MDFLINSLISFSLGYIVARYNFEELITDLYKIIRLQNRYISLLNSEKD